MNGRKTRVILLLRLTALGLSNVLTLKKENYITCVVTGASVNSAVYINPPLRTRSTNAADELSNNLNSDDWFTEDSDPSRYNPIIDEDWEDQTEEDQTAGLFLNQEPIHPSIYVRRFLNFIFFSKNWSLNTTFAVTKFQVTESNESWINFTLKRKNNTIEILAEDEVIQMENIGFEGPYWVYMETPDLNSTSYRIHGDSVTRPPEINWIQDDWVITHSNLSSYSPLTDKRWEDLNISYESEPYPLRENPFSFSIYTTGPITFTVSSHDFANNAIFEFKAEESHSTLIPSSCRWFHYSVSTHNDTVNILKGDEVLKTIKLNFSSPYWVYVDSPCSNTTFWKVHNYEFRSSNTVTSSNAEMSYLNVSLTDNLCISLYVSVDRGSFLQVTLESNTKSETSTILGFNQENSLKSWKMIELKTDSPGLAKLSFFRGHTQNQKQGYWAIDDVKLCNRDPEIYQIKSSTTLTKEHTCEVLDESNMNVDMNYFLKPGSLGTVNCSTVLGASYPYCENHRICLADSICFCSWGYQGHFCNQTCDVGTWGLFCSQECPFRCRRCHLATGECLEERDDNLSLSETEFPKSIVLHSGQIHIEMPNYEDINGEITYNFKYYCMSEWCLNQIIKQENYTISSAFNYKEEIIQRFDKIVPFTDYKPIVAIVRRNETIEKSFSAITAQPELDDIKLSLYSSNATHLWARFQPSQASFENTINYSIWYSQDGRPINSLQIQPCKLWDDFLCGTIANLKKDTFYSITVGERNFQDGTFRISSSTVGFTSEKAPEAPTNFELKKFSDKKIVLTWNQPTVANGPIQYFDLEIRKQETIEHYNISATDEITYEQEISVTPGINYSCSVRAVNTYQGENTSISIKIAPPTLRWHLPQPFAEICYEVCYLVIPKPKEYNYSAYFFLPIHNSDVLDMETERCKIVNSLGTDLHHDEKLWIPGKPQEDTNFIRWPELGKAASLEEQDINSIHLILVVDNKYVVYNSNCQTENIVGLSESWSVTYTMITICVIILLFCTIGPFLLFTSVVYKSVRDTYLGYLHIKLSTW